MTKTESHHTSQVAQFVSITYPVILLWIVILRRVEGAPSAPVRPARGVKKGKRKSVQFSADTKMHSVTSNDQIAQQQNHRVTIEPDGFMHAVQNILGNFIQSYQFKYISVYLFLKPGSIVPAGFQLFHLKPVLLPCT